jgi:hypothetical protein
VRFVLGRPSELDLAHKCTVKSLADIKSKETVLGKFAVEVEKELVPLKFFKSNQVRPHKPFFRGYLAPNPCILTTRMQIFGDGLNDEGQLVAM